MRTILGLLSGEEASIAEKLRELNTQRAHIKEEIDERQKAPAYLYRRYTKKLKEILNIEPDAKISFEADNLFGILQRVKSENERLTNEITEFEKKTADIDFQIADLSAIIRDLTDGFEYWTSLLQRAEAGSNELKENQEERESERKKLEESVRNKTCRYAPIKVEECDNVRSYLNSTNLQGVRDSKEEKKLISERQANIPKLKSEIARYETELVMRQKERQKLFFKRQDFAHKREVRMQRQRELGNTYQELTLWKGLSEGTQPDPTLSQLIDQLNQMEQKKQTMEEQLNQLLQTHNENLDNLRKIFNCVVKMSLSEEFEGLVSFKQGELAFQIVRGKTMAGEAIETLKILLADVTAVILGMCNSGYHPSFLVHDSPREADLGARIYSRFLNVAAKLHNYAGGINNVPFQYIVTTTTNPPPKLQSEEFVRLKLDAKEENHMLFCKNIGTTDIEVFSPQLSLL